MPAACPIIPSKPQREGRLAHPHHPRVAAGALNGQPIDKLSLHDVVRFPDETLKQGSRPAPSFDILVGDLADRAETEKLGAAGPDVIFPLAGVVSGEAEIDFDKGYRVNLDGTRALLEAIRRHGEGYHPKLVFSSSMAVYGAPFPPAVPDDFHLTPLTSYGTQKAICELLLADYHRRGFLDGVGIRLPTICVRPGKPNQTASGFFSGIIRAPPRRQPGGLPGDDTARPPHARGGAAVGSLTHAAGLTCEQLGPRINLSMPGVCCTVAEQIEALARVAGQNTAAPLRAQPHDPR